MFNVTETLDPALIEKPLSVLWENISPLYLADEDALVANLLALAIRITSYNVCYTKLLRVSGNYGKPGIWS